MISFWLLVGSQWLHLLASVIWLGGLVMIALFAWPAWRRGTLATNEWLRLQRRFALWANASLIVLLITGFYQMTNNANYSGFLVLDSIWSWAILLKHLAFGTMVIITAYLQFWLYPAVARLAVLAEKRPELAGREQAQYQAREIRLLRLNLICAGGVLLCTAVATAA